MVLKKNQLALFLSVSVSIIYAVSWMLLSSFFHTPLTLLATPAAQPAAFQFGIGFLYIIVPSFFVFMLMRKQVNRMVLVQSELKTANDTLEGRVKSRTAELEKSIYEIKTLKGMLTICANCKNIRNGQGKWEPVESYIQRHSDVEFSHGLCTDCKEALYGKDFSRFVTAQADRLRAEGG